MPPGIGMMNASPVPLLTLNCGSAAIFALSSCDCSGWGVGQISSFLHYKF
jgi:hypothetical protein